MAGGVALGGLFSGVQQAVPRAELWAVLLAVEHASGATEFPIDNEMVCNGMAFMSRDPSAYQIDLSSEMADIWTALEEILVDKRLGFCSAVWVAMEVLPDPELEQKRLDKLRRARAQPAWQEDRLGYNDRADQAATRARGIASPCASR